MHPLVVTYRPLCLPVTAVLYGLGIPEPHPVQPLIGLQKIIDWTISTVLDLPASLAFVLLARCSLRQLQGQNDANLRNPVASELSPWVDQKRMEQEIPGHRRW
jgi:hypothetical protein